MEKDAEYKTSNICWKNALGLLKVILTAIIIISLAVWATVYKEDVFPLLGNAKEDMLTWNITLITGEISKILSLEQIFPSAHQWIGDPVVVWLQLNAEIAKNAYPSTIKRYYFNIDDPQRLIEIKFTPINIPHIYFSIPRLAGEYRFAAEIYNNLWATNLSWLIVTTEDDVKIWPTLFFPPSSMNPDIPMVTLKIDKPNAKVGETITLEALAKITNERTDFSSQRKFSYDFEWDWIWDMTTKDSKLTYVYKKTGSFTPRVKVTYRGYSGVATAERVNIEKWIRAWFLYATVGKTLIVRDASYGDIENRKFCVDTRECKSNPNRLIENQTYFKKEYPEAGKYVVIYTVNSINGETSVENDIIEIKEDIEDTNNVGIITLPSPNKDGKVVVGNALDKKVLFYVSYNGTGDCYIDTDISKDSKNGGNADQNKDITCNTVTLFEYKDQIPGSTLARVYFGQWDQLISKDIPIEFLDFNVEIPAEKKEIYSLINTTIEEIHIWNNDINSSKTESATDDPN